MDASGLPIPALIAALRSGTPPQAMDVDAVAAAMNIVVDRLGLGGIRLELLDTGPLSPSQIDLGTLVADEGGQRATVRGAAGNAIASLWVDGPEDARLAAIAAIGSAVQAAGAHVRADRSEAHLAALDDAVRGIAGVLTTARVLQLIVDRVRVLADAQYAALGTVDDEGRITAFYTSGVSAETRARIGPLPEGHGLLGLIIRENASFRIPDIGLDPRRHGFPPNHPEMHSFLGVPVIVRGRSMGNLYLTNKAGRVEFSPEDQALVERFALHAGIAIDNAHLHEQVQRLAVVEERERIGRDLHDGIIQRIYGVNLSLDDVPELVSSDPSEAARRVDAAIDSLNAAIGSIREFIYVLRAPGDSGSDLPSALQALASELQLHDDLRVEVHADNVPHLRGADAAELLQVAREALSNTLRHASAGHARVELAAERGVVRLELADDGRGFETDVLRDESHRGLANMRERAARLGATLRISSAPGQGTRITLEIPVTETEEAPAADG